MCKVIWFTGMSGAGKTTIAEQLKRSFETKGCSVCHLDGDAFRKIRKRENRFTVQDITQNIEDAISVCEEKTKKHDYVFTTFISPFRNGRDKARELFGDGFVEVEVYCPIDTLVKRDTKGLYKKAVEGVIDNLIGFSEKIPYERPLNPEITLNTDSMNVEDSVKQIESYLARG